MVKKTGCRSGYKKVDGKCKKVGYQKTMKFYGKTYFYLIGKRTKKDALKEVRFQQNKLGKSARIAHRMDGHTKYAVYIRPKG